MPRGFFLVELRSCIWRSDRTLFAKNNESENKMMEEDPEGILGVVVGCEPMVLEPGEEEDWKKLGSSLEATSFGLVEGLDLLLLLR